MSDSKNNSKSTTDTKNILLEALRKKKEKQNNHAHGANSAKGGSSKNEAPSGNGRGFSPVSSSIGHRPTGR